MPEIKFVDPGRGVHPVDLFTVLATMVHPADEAARKDYVAVQLAANLEKPGLFGDLLRQTERAAPISKAELARLHSLEDTRQRAKEAAHYGGFVAGEILTYIVNTVETRPQDATVRKAIHALGVLLARKKYKNGRPIPASPRSIKQGWYEYWSVSHFWGARLVADSAKPTDFSPGRWDSLRDFLTVAEELRQRGEALVPAGAQKPLLDPRKTWCCPAALRLPRREMIMPGPSPETVNILSNYTNDST